jgi:DNA-binding transcriptional MerR regulator
MAQYGTTEVAQVCGISLNTVRQWANDYSAFLGPNARGEQGDRAFSTNDLEVLKYVAQLRSERMRKDAIIQRLGETTFPEIEQADQPLSELALPDATESHHAAPGAIVGLDAINTLERRFEALEAGRKDFAQGVALGFIGALVFVIFLLLLFLLRNYL